MMLNVGVMLSGPIQYIMEKTAGLIEVQAKLVVFAAASALQVRQSAEVVREASRRLSRQIMVRNPSRQLSSVDDKHIKRLTTELPSRRPSLLQSSVAQDTVTASAMATVPAAQSLQPDHWADSDIVSKDKIDPMQEAGVKTGEVVVEQYSCAAQAPSPEQSSANKRALEQPDTNKGALEHPSTNTLLPLSQVDSNDRYIDWTLFHSRAAPAQTHVAATANEDGLAEERIPDKLLTKKPPPHSNAAGVRLKAPLRD